MGWRSQMEDRYTVTCRRCGAQFIDTAKHPNRRWLATPCPRCERESVGAGAASATAGALGRPGG